MSPPLVVDRNGIDRIADIMAGALDRAAADLRAGTAGAG
jgi:hypothetical protein